MLSELSRRWIELTGVSHLYSSCLLRKNVKGFMRFMVVNRWMNENNVLNAKSVYGRAQFPWNKYPFFVRVSELSAIVRHWRYLPSYGSINNSLVIGQSFVHDCYRRTFSRIILRVDLCCVQIMMSQIFRSNYWHCCRCVSHRFHYIAKFKSQSGGNIRLLLNQSLNDSWIINNERNE